MRIRHLDHFPREPGLRCLLALVAASATLSASACGEGATSVAGPTAGKCQISVTSFTRNFTAEGGTGSVSLTTARECSWSASTSTAWISFPTRPSGQGEASFSFQVGANAQPKPRDGAIDLSGQRLAISQEAATCRFTIDPRTSTFTAAGGSGSFRVSAITGCGWTAESTVEWARVASGSGGDGNGEVTFVVDPNAGPARTGRLFVADGEAHAIEQAAAGTQPAPVPPPPACNFAVNPTSLSFQASGGQAAVQLTAAEGCAWTTSSGTSWLSVAPASGSGSAAITVAAAPNTATTPRSATVTVAGLTVPVTQQAAASACQYSLSPATATVGAEGGQVSLSLSTAVGCAWTASDDAEWVTVEPPTSGTGPATVRVTVAENVAEASRQATVTVGQASTTLTQLGAPAPPPPCTFAVTPLNVAFAEGGGQAQVELATGDGCTWTASSGAAWLQVAPTGGTGPATIGLTAAANDSEETRTTTATIAGVAVTVTQEGAPPLEVSVEGKVKNLAGACPLVTFEVRGEAVATTASTVYGPDPPGRACGDLHDGLEVIVTGFRQSGVIVATLILIPIEDGPQP